MMVRVTKELRCRESVLQRDPRGMQRGTTRYDERLLLSLLKFILNSSEKLFYPKTSFNVVQFRVSDVSVTFVI